MIEYRGKFAGVVIRADQLRYVVAETLNQKMLVIGCGSLNAKDKTPEAFAPLVGRRIICGIESSHCSQRKILLPESGISDDPDHLLWEISRTYTEALQNYFFSFARLNQGLGSRALSSMAVRKESAASIGRFFDSRNLVLEKLIMEPEAIRQVMKKVIDSDRAMALVIESGQAHLQIFRQRQMICHQSIALPVAIDQEKLRMLSEEIGVLLLNHFGGQPLRREVTLLLVGKDQEQMIARAMTETLPYDFDVKSIDITSFDCIVAKDAAVDGSQYFLPFSLAYLYNDLRQCESSPEKDVVWH